MNYKRQKESTNVVEFSRKRKTHSEMHKENKLQIKLSKIRVDIWMILYIVLSCLSIWLYTKQFGISKVFPDGSLKILYIIFGIAIIIAVWLILFLFINHFGKLTMTILSSFFLEGFIFLCQSPGTTYSKLFVIVSKVVIIGLISIILNEIVEEMKSTSYKGVYIRLLLVSLKYSIISVIIAVSIYGVLMLSNGYIGL